MNDIDGNYRTTLPTFLSDKPFFDYYNLQIIKNYSSIKIMYINNYYIMSVKSNNYKIEKFNLSYLISDDISNSDSINNLLIDLEKIVKTNFEIKEINVCKILLCTV